MAVVPLFIPVRKQRPVVINDCMYLRKVLQRLSATLDKQLCLRTNID